MRALFRICLCVIAAFPYAGFADVSGTYIDERNPSIALVLVESADGSISGNFEGLSDAVPVTARRNGDAFAGTIGGDAYPMDVSATIAGETITLVLTDEGVVETHVFRRTGAAPESAAELGGAAVADPTPGLASSGERNVVINDKRLTDAQLALIEQTYGVRILDAEYWYDGVSGAWGIEGGPTRGFIYSGLELGGPLRADASGGGTKVFINGRELHPLDVAGLQACVQVLPGRYRVTADGNAGYEGGPPLFNLVQLCSPPARDGRSGGWLCDGGSCGTSRTVTGPYAVTSEGGGQAGVYTDRGLILTPN